MDYELAKELKDAGFPQKTGRVVFADTYVDHEGNLITTPDEAAYPPSLDELIEACGDKFRCLYRIDRTDDGKCIFWSAGYDNLAINHFTGPTPIIAVARLWLALNAK